MTPLYRIGLAVVLLGIAAAAQAQSDKPQPEKPPATPAKPAASATKPGSDRWSIKTASDVEAKEIDRTPAKSTVEKLLALPRPLDMPLDGSNPFFQTHRAHPAEATVFTVEADVVDCRLMPDGDYRVTVRGASGKTMVLEMPNPGPDYVDPKSKFASDVKAARGQFEAKAQPEKAVKPVSGHAHITGVGFFGRTYGGKTPEGNLIQLHPVLKIEWLDKPTAEFNAPQDTPENGGDKNPASRRAPVKPAKKSGPNGGNPR